jgi:hypothetical protein
MALSNFVDKKVNDKTTIIEKFNKQINKDITELFVEVADIKEEANVSDCQFFIYNINRVEVFLIYRMY